MLTPNDIAEKKFDKVIMGGYDMGAVDDFLDQLENDFAAYIKENALLKNKMKLLVKKVEEYRSMDESMRSALGSAQTMASQIIDKANAEAQAIREGAEKERDEILSGYKTQIDAEERKLSEAKASVEDFVTRMTTMYSQGAEMLRTVVDKYSVNDDLNISGEAVKTNSAPVQHFSPAPLKNAAAAAPVKEEIKKPAVEVSPATVIEKIPAAPAPAPAAEKIPAAVVAPAPAPVIEKIPAAPIKSEPAEPVPAAEPVKTAAPSKPAIADTAKLPGIPPVGSVKPQGNFSTGTVYPNTVVRHNAKEGESDDEGETILLTPKPKFEFNNLQFGQNYNENGKK